jgi:hypothetical protein
MRTPFFKTDKGMAKSTSSARFHGERRKRYPASRHVDGTSYTAPIEVLMDPRAKISEANLEKQFTLGEEARNLEETDHTMVLEIRDLRNQLDALENRLGKSEGDNAVRTSVDDIKKKLDAIENQASSLPPTKIS